jgi:Cysteine-rich CWC
MNEPLVRCPRCDAEVRCGAADPTTPCACHAVALDAPTLAALRERYAGCLCLACLREAQRGSLRADTPSA